MHIRRFSLPSPSQFLSTGRFQPLREYIQQSLYHPTEGYFSKERPPLLQTSAIHFPSVPSRESYQNKVATQYARTSHGWMTPVQLFTPHLSHAIANRIRSSSPSDRPLHIIELGAGRATLAQDILSYFAGCHSDFLSTLTYTLVDISPSLSHMQSATLSPWISSGVARVVCADARRYLSKLSTSEAHVHILATELLDNLPHDLIRIMQDGQIEQAYLTNPSHKHPTQNTPELQWHSHIDSETHAAMHAFGLDERVHAPSASSLAESMVEFFNHMVNDGMREVWVPTVSHALLQSVMSSMPKASLTLADFTAFPGTLPGTLAPVIQRVGKGTTVVFDSVQEAPFGQVDIMFPTDFHRLSHAHSALTNLHNGDDMQFQRQVISQANFFKSFATTDGLADTRCADGYNPLLNDFENAAFWLCDALDA